MVRIEHEDPEKFKRWIKDIVGRYLDLAKHKLFFFGSRVTGKGDDRSDIDIGILGEQPVPDEALYRIRHDIEGLPILYKVDVVDFAAAREQFKQVALEKIEYIE